MTSFGVSTVLADDYGSEDNDDSNDDPCDPSSPAFSISACNSADQCDMGDPNYDSDVCEMQTCNTSSVNYDVDECDAQVCDDSSDGFNADNCENETCLSDNINYDPTECAEQVCDETSNRYNDRLCDISTCDYQSPNYELGACSVHPDACAGRADVNTWLSNLSNVISTIRGDINGYNNWEWGQNVTMDSYSPGATMTDGNSPYEGLNNGWKPDQTHDETRGYWIGAVHSHPNGTSFSPQDIYSMYAQYLTLARDPNVTVDQLAYYRNNAFLVDVTTDYTYVLTLQNWGALEHFVENYDSNAGTINRQYASDIAAGLSSEQALLKAVGSSINLYKADVGSNSAAPEAKNSDGNVSEVNCN